MCGRRWYVICKQRLGDLEGIFSIARKSLPCATHSDDANIEVAQGDHEAAHSFCNGLQTPERSRFCL